jgi:hypothetical protein
MLARLGQRDVVELQAVNEHIKEQDASIEVDPAHDTAAQRDHLVRHVVEEGEAR